MIYVDVLIDIMRSLFHCLFSVFWVMVGYHLKIKTIFQSWEISSFEVAQLQDDS